MIKNDEFFMKQAFKEAKKAFEKGEVPIGCVIVDNKTKEILARAHNLKEQKEDVTAHAEILAIKKASKKIGNWRLSDTTLYVTVEPCVMCAGAIIQSRIRNVYYGAKDYKGGALGSSINVLEAKNINHHLNVKGGILEEECSLIISNYFKQKRKKEN